MMTAEIERLVTLVRAQFGLPDLVLHLARLLATAGHPVTVAELASAGGWSEDELRAELARHPSVDWDEDGRIAGFGLTLRPTPHRFTFDGRTVYAFCATDTFEFPVILGQPGVVESSCAATGQPVRVELTPDRVVSVDPPEAVVSKVRPDHAVDDLRAEICNLGSFFSSPQAAADWLRHNPQGAIAPVREDFEITRSENPQKVAGQLYRDFPLAHDITFSCFTLDRGQGRKPAMENSFDIFRRNVDRARRVVRDL